jgi:hypothetical protein
MATYYVRTDGSDSNTGLGSTTALAWRTVQKALGATGIGSGDIVYIAPGHYNETVTVGGTYSAETQIIGDPTAAQFSGVSPGYVKLSQFTSAGTSARNLTQLLISASKSYLHFKNLYFELAQVGEVLMSFTNARFISFTGCVFYHNLRPAVGNYTLSIANPSGQTSNTTIQNCVFYNNPYMILQSVVSGDATVLKNNLFINGYQESIQLFQCTATVYNCTFAIASTGMRITGSSVVTANNCLFTACSTAVLISAGTYNENYNRYIGNSTNVQGTYTPGGNSTSTGIVGIESAYSLLHSLNNAVVFGSVNGSQNASFGTATGAPTTDLFGVAWTGSSPDAGAITYRNPSGVGSYNPTERNASAITIAPASTSQSIELYLGATGLTFATSGLAAYYVRNREAPTPITLVTQTPTGTWTSGGFAEISSSLVPGVYRLDVPDAAFAAGASDVTIVVRGASGTNGAVLTVTLSSGGLTEAQTAGAVWNAVRATYPTAGTFGEYVNVNVNSGAIADAVWDEARSGHTTVGTFGEYVNAELVTPVAAATSVHIGPYQLLADGLGADQPLDVNVGTATSIDVQVTDANGTGIDITGATVTAKVYSSAGTLVATYSGTATYADNGRLTFGLTTTVTNTSGTYTVTVTRTTGATDTQIFGPLRLYVRPV